MTIVVTGNMGYVGSAVVSYLRREMPSSLIVGVDSGMFGHCISHDELPECAVDIQVFRDIRDITPELFAGVHAVVHLAAISNDPMGRRFEAVTREINELATIRAAELAAAGGVRHFVFASSCSMYGQAEGRPRTEGDGLAPLTAYARSKVAAEAGLRQIAARGSMAVTALRFATACGFSGRMRLDLVLNDLVASALATGCISVLSDGTPWRPLIHVEDMARAIGWAMTRPTSPKDRFLAVNAGSEEWNYQVAQLADAVRAEIPATTIDINRNAAPDKRSYRVDFGLYKSIAPDHQPQMSLKQAIRDISEGLRRIGFDDPGYRSSQFVRLNVLSSAVDAGRLRPDLRRTATPPGGRLPMHYSARAPAA